MADGVSFEVKVNGLEGVLTRFNALGALDRHELMESLGRLGQMQTRRRLEVEKTTPGGVAWKLTRDGRAGLFVTGTHLARSIDYEASETEARWGTGVIMARVHQYGATITPKNAKTLVFTAGGTTVFAKRVTIPAREYVGLSEANQAQMIRVAERFIGEVAGQ